MKGNYQLSDKKLSDEEFKEKYYVKGLDQQYHTMDLSDGVDERQQLLINNDRWLFDAYKYAIDFCINTTGERMQEIVRNIRIAATLALAAAILNVIVLITLWI